MIVGKELLDRLFSSQSKGELLFLFHSNPNLADTLEGIANRLNLDIDVLVRDVDELLKVGLLKKKCFQDAEVFFLDEQKDMEIQEMIAEYMVSTLKYI